MPGISAGTRTSGVMARDLCARLAEEGHDVTVITQFPNRPFGKILNGYRRSLRSAEYVDGFAVIRCPNWLLDRQRSMNSKGKSMPLMQSSGNWRGDSPESRGQASHQEKQHEERFEEDRS